MCVFCSAAPAVLTLGLTAEARQHQARKTAVAEGQSLGRKIPFLPLTVLAFFGIIASSVLYHTQLRGA